MSDDARGLPTPYLNDDGSQVVQANLTIRVRDIARVRALVDRPSPQGAVTESTAVARAVVQAIVEAPFERLGLDLIETSASAAGVETGAPARR